MKGLRGGAVSCALSAIAMMIGGAASAGPLVITPTTIVFAPGKRSAAIEITNRGDTPTDLQFRAYDWSQPGGIDRLSTTSDLIVSPPIATLPPHGTQTFRVVSVGAADALHERSFRLRLNELPRPLAGAIAINIEFSLPVFMTPAGARSEIAWQRAPGNANAIDIANHGTRRIRLASLSITSRTGSTALPMTSTIYILAGASKRIPWPNISQIGDDAHLVGTSDTGSIDVPLAAVAAR